MKNIQSMIDVLQQKANEIPDKTAYIFLKNGEIEEDKITYKELDEKARALAVMLSEIIETEDRVLLLYPSNIEYIVGFFACLYAGGIAVTAYPPSLSRPSARLRSIINDAKPKLVLASSSIMENKDKIVSHTEELGFIKWMDNNQSNIKEANNWKKPEDLSNKIAFLQYTSGSTSLPKGVMVSHKNLIENEKLIYKAFGHTKDTIVFGWLPLFHDMGLIGNMLQPIFAGASCVFMEPSSFIKKPIRWLKGISNYKATTSGGPNFAYDLCVQKIKEEEMSDINLESWQVTYNGSEPVRYDTLKEFYSKFKKSGFSYSSFYPCYGLAEATLLVSGSKNKKGPSTFTVDNNDLDLNCISEATDNIEHKTTFVSSGRIWAEQKTIIINPEDMTICDENHVGEIWVQGKSVATGYWMNPEKTEETFKGKIKDHDSGYFLRTGDLGFIKKEELYVTGRIKDLIIIRGRNYYPQDIEHVAEISHFSLKPGYNAAFSIFMAGEERLVLVQGVERSADEKELDDALDCIQKAVAEEFELDLYSIVFVRPGDISKTSSGKVQRSECKKKFLSCQFSNIKEKTKTFDSVLKIKLNDITQIEEWLIQQIAAKCGISRDEIDVNLHPTNYGFDSLNAMEQIYTLESVFKISLPFEIFFESPSIKELAIRIREHATEKSKNSPEIKILRDQNIQLKDNLNSAPLSFAQQRIWFLNQMMADNSVYNIGGFLELKGKIDIESLKKSFHEIQKNHSTLRTIFILKDEIPIQKVLDTSEVIFETFDVSNLSENKKIDEIEKIKLEKSKLQFHLEEKPCWYSCVIHKSKDENILLVIMHHIISDGWSMNIFLKEILNYYQAFSENEPINAAELPIQYIDFVRWQNEWLEDNEINKHLPYWNKKLSKEDYFLELPADFPRKTVQSFNGKRHLFNLPEELSSKLKELSKNQEVTLFVFLLSCYLAFLYRYTNHESISVGTPIANRSKKETKDLIGLFVDTLVLKTELSGELSFLELLKRVRQTTIEGFEHQNVPFTKLVENIQPERNTGHNPLFQVMFILQNAPSKPFNINGLKIVPGQIDNRTAKFELTLELFETDNNISGWFEYNTDLFKEETINRMSIHFQNIIKTIISKPEIEIDKIQLLSKDEYELVMNEWNDTLTQFPEDETPCSLIKKQCMARGESIAVSFNEKHLSYAELDRLSDKLALFLIEEGLVSGSLIGIHMERSVDMVISLLAVWKAGCAYVPLDPYFPKDRLEYMIEDADCKFILSHSILSGSINVGTRKVIYLDEQWQSIKENIQGNIQLSIDPKNLAYVIYTSGSTGKPKGVEIEQLALTNFLLSMSRQPGLIAGDNLLSVTTFSFDIAALELFLPLISGARVVIAGKEETINGELLAKKLSNEDITVMQATPATWRLLIETGWNGKKNLKALCGGEALPVELANELLKRVDSLWNMYGPTETTIWSSMEKISEKDSTILIGKPIANTQFYIVDRKYNIVPIGISGELCIGGMGLARGYHNREDLTKEKFISNPFSKNKNDRIYKTGDLARYTHDGKIEYLGRIDNQVKIRGFRIELGEIESILKKYPEVEKALVVAKEVIKGEKSLIAYIIASNQKNKIDTNILKKHLKEYIPDYMVPSFFMFLESFPLTLNGKINRKGLPLPDDIDRDDKTSFIAPTNQTEVIITEIWKSILHQKKIGINDNFFDAGGHSLLLVKLHHKLQENFQRTFPLLDLFKFTTIASQAEYLQKDKTKNIIQKKSTVNIKPSNRSHKIAVIGLSCRFPGAKNHKEFWQNLCNGVESIKHFSNEELVNAGIDESLLNNPNYVKSWGVIEEADLFDANFFGFHPREAEIIDPQQRVFLEECYKGLEDAGYDSNKYNGLIGLFAGIGMNTYLKSSGNKPDELAKNYQYMISNDKDFLATRIAYKLNLKGPAMTVQTACSTSLVAVHLACRSLLSCESDIALAGGVSIRFPQNVGYIYQEGMILSPDGHCRAFDENASGTVGGNGAGVVVLKRLEEAINDNDNIYAVILSTAINNDGSDKIGYTAPSTTGQEDVISRAINNSGIDLETISYIETHGTGTKLGDPIEIQALQQVFGTQTNKEQYCALGSVKTNIGHLDTASGIAGFIKTALSIYYKKIPPIMHFHKPNSKIIFDKTPFYINSELKEWRTKDIPLRAGVSSFGIGGTNAHAILEEAPEKNKNSLQNNHKLLVWSAKNKESLERMNDKYLDFFNGNKDINIHDLSYTLTSGRKELESRQAIVSQTIDDVISILKNKNAIKPFIINTEGNNFDTVFMFTGQGSQYIKMTYDLYQNEPVFKFYIDECCSLLKSIIDIDLKEIIYPKEESREIAEKKLNQTNITQPALFVIEYALAKLWMSFGLMPSAMIGHSIGEYVAACIADVFSLKDAINIVAKRASLMQKILPGSMLAVFDTEKNIKDLLTSDLSVAAINSPGITIISGTNPAIKDFEELLTKKKIYYKGINTSHAFHSQMMDPVLDEFKGFLEKINFNKPKLPFISNVTGKWIENDKVCSPEYWVKHLRGTVRFSDGITELLKSPNRVLLEIGPGDTLFKLVQQHNFDKKTFMILSSIPNPKEKISEHYYFLTTLAKLWVNNVKINLNQYYETRPGKKISLPAYPFERTRFWINQKKEIELNKEETIEGKRNDFLNWFYVPSWKRSQLIYKNSLTDIKDKNILIFLDDLDLGQNLSEKLINAGAVVTIIKKSHSFKKESDCNYQINPDDENDYIKLFQELQKSNYMPEIIFHLRNFTEYYNDSIRMIEERIINSYYSIINMAKSISSYLKDKKIKIIVVSNGLQNVLGNEHLDIEKSTLRGVVRVISQEFPKIICQSIDFNEYSDKEFSEQLINEIYFESAQSETFISYRGAYRWIEDYEKLNLLKMDNTNRVPHLKADGVYLITGGLGGLGLSFAEYISKNVKSKIILTTSKPFPLRKDWQMYIQGNGKLSIKNRIKKIIDIEKNGSEVSIYEANVTILNEMENLFLQIENKFKKVDGVIHAAGIAGGGLISLKDRQNQESVLSPKIQGTLILDECLKGKKLDFFVLFSSITSILGGIGQADYSAANSFLDAYAQSANRNNKDRITMSINWDTWKEVGMAINYQNDPVEEDLNNFHPILKKVLRSIDNLDYIGFLSQDEWIVNEHWILGKSVVPGTTYLEMVYAASNHEYATGSIELEDIYFLTPLTIDEKNKITLHTALKKTGSGYDFIVKSRPFDSKDDRWHQHAKGKINKMEKSEAVKNDLVKLISSCDKKEILNPEENAYLGRIIRREGNEIHKNQVEFGPRWNNIKWIKLGVSNGIALLELPEEFKKDVSSFMLHPALLDCAVAFLRLFKYEGIYLPLSYKKLKITGRIPGKIYSYAEISEGSESEKKVLNINIKIMDEKGIEIINIEKFTMIEVDQTSFESSLKTTFFIRDRKKSGNFIDNLQTQNIQNGIRTEEGLEAWKYILRLSLPQVVVSTRNFSEQLKLYQNLNVSELVEERNNDEERELFPRPELKTDYISPKSEIERKLALLWQKLLGIDKIGIYDNIFELGGDSLLIVQLHKELVETFKTEISVVDLYKYTTITSLVKYLQEGKDKSQPSFESINERVLKKKEAMQNRRKKRSILQ